MRRLVVGAAAFFVLWVPSATGAAIAPQVMDDDGGGPRCTWNPYWYIDCDLWSCWWVGRYEWPWGERCA